jgi:hypothetical protein
MTCQIRQLSPAGYPLVISVIDQWWGGLPMAVVRHRMKAAPGTEGGAAFFQRRRGLGWHWPSAGP